MESAPCICVGLSGCSEFLPHSKDIQVRQNGDIQFPVGLNVSINVCVLFTVYPATVYPATHIQGLSPAPHNPTKNTFLGHWVCGGF